MNSNLEMYICFSSHSFFFLLPWVSFSRSFRILFESPPAELRSARSPAKCPCPGAGNSSPQRSELKAEASLCYGDFLVLGGVFVVFGGVWWCFCGVFVVFGGVFVVFGGVFVAFGGVFVVFGGVFVVFGGVFVVSYCVWLVFGGCFVVEFCVLVALL